MNLSISDEIQLQMGCNLKLTVLNILRGEVAARLSIPNKYGRIFSIDYVPLGFNPGQINKMTMLPIEDSIVILTGSPVQYKLWCTSDYIHYWEEMLPDIDITLDIV